jgi:hypothetical protein
MLRRALSPGGADLPSLAASAQQVSGPAERFLDAVSECLLRWRTPGGNEDFLADSRPGETPADRLRSIGLALRAADGLQPGSLARRRLVAIAQRLGVPADLSAPGSDASRSGAGSTGGPVLPPAWAAVLDSLEPADSHDPAGHQGSRTGWASPLAGVLPELDGTRCVLAGLRQHETACLHVLAWNWPHYFWRVLRLAAAVLLVGAR